MNTIRVVAGIAVSGRKVFIARRSADRSLGGMWEFPGGKVESGETDEIALARKRPDLEPAITEKLKAEAEQDAETWQDDLTPSPGQF